MASKMADISSNGERQSHISGNSNFSASSATESNVTPAYIYKSDTADLDGYDIGLKIMSIVGEGLVRTVQNVKNLWRIYFNTHQSKVDFITQGIDINNKKIRVYNSNPFATGAIRSGVSPHEIDKIRMVKVLVKDLYESVHNDQVVHLFENVFKVKLASEVKYAHYRRNHHLTGMRNGDRFVWIHPDQLEQPLPRNARIGNFSCRIFHWGQFKNKPKECYNCFEVGHLGKDCTKPKVCKVCKDPSHSEGTPLCVHFNRDSSNILPFGGKKDPFSNHFEREFEHNHVKSKTAEGHWFYQKAMANGQDILALDCLAAETGIEAKILGKSIRCTEDWDRDVRGVNIMKSIIKSKVESVPEAKECLKHAWENQLTIVESVPNFSDRFWGSALDKESTKNTLPEHWPGDNALGKIWMQVATEIFGEHVEPKPLPQRKSAALQREIDLDTGRSGVQHVVTDSTEAGEIVEKYGWDTYDQFPGDWSESENDSEHPNENDNGSEETPTRSVPTDKLSKSISDKDIGDLVAGIRQKTSFASKLAGQIARSRSRSNSSTKSAKGKQRHRSPSPKSRSSRSVSLKRALNSPNEGEKSEKTQKLCVQNSQIVNEKHENGSSNGS